MLLPFWGFEIGQCPVFRGVFKIFVSFLGRLCKFPNICLFVCCCFFFGGGGGGGVDPVRAILGVIQFLYLNSNMSLIISRNASKAF